MEFIFYSISFIVLLYSNKKLYHPTRFLFCDREYDCIFNIDTCISGTKIHIVKHYIPKVALTSLLLRESSKMYLHSAVSKQELHFPFECASLLQHVSTNSAK